MTRIRCAQSLFGTALLLTACGPSLDEEIGENRPDLTFEEFEASAYHEDFEGGVYIVNGDEPVANRKLLREFYDQLYTKDALIVNRAGGGDDRWSDTAKLNLTYCVSSSASNRATLVAAMNAAAANWEAAANVNFVHSTQFDASCTASQSGVVFDVRTISGQSYLARAFFPSSSRASRNVLVDTAAFSSSWSLTNILTHELGHTLGFRHEHTRPEAATCFEDSNWRQLTAYDRASTMHYPQCNGTSNTLAMTALDRQGAASLYGAPGGGNPDPDPDPTCTPTSGSASGSLAVNQQTRYQPLAVSAGSNFRVVMTGSGDPDLYVRFGTAPTLTQFNCRPFLDGANEVCDLTVPAGQSQAHIMVNGFTAASYTINVSWCTP